MNDKDEKESNPKITEKEARAIASEVFREEYTAGLLVGLCIGAAFGIGIAFISHS